LTDTKKISPLISIALCTYNGAAYLKQQLDTLLLQTYSNIELIVVDDASTDETIHIIESYTAKDNRIFFFQNEKNIGFNNNFEKALSLCMGEWIAIADQDDIWHLTKIERMLNHWNGDSVLIHCSSKKFRLASEINAKAKPSANGFSGDNVSAIAAKNTTEGHNILLHQSLVKLALPFPSGIFYDWWLGAVAAANGGVQWEDEILVWRRIHETNAYEKQLLPVLNEKIVWKNHLTAFLSIPGLPKQHEQFIANCLELINKNAGAKEWQHFILKNQYIFFYYKKGIFAFVSRWKNTHKLAKQLSEKP
jgi:glycosyltransferase involved in cell wall biosynthesis